jgi:hypothetical protein
MDAEALVSSFCVVLTSANIIDGGRDEAHRRVICGEEHDAPFLHFYSKGYGGWARMALWTCSWASAGLLRPAMFHQVSFPFFFSFLFSILIFECIIEFYFVLLGF